MSAPFDAGVVSDELAEACVRANKITTERDARFRRVAGASLGAATVAAVACVNTPHLGLLALSLDGSEFGFLQVSPTSEVAFSKARGRP